MSDALAPGDDVEQYLRRHEQKEILRFVAVGSVDDGKSTLMGRLLHDTGGVYEDQLRAVRKASQMGGTEIDFSLFTDGLKAEREQGITIDVAYRYFTTARRKFIIADTPGHVQYTRNMATGASTANVAIILIDARLGVLTQSRRHAYIAALLGIPHLVVGVNKMDLVGYDEATFRRIEEEITGFASRLGVGDVRCIPVSALKGDNVVHGSAHTPWYGGPTVLELLDTLPIAQDRNLTQLRFPVQTVIRPHLDYRGYAGQLASGVVRRGDRVVVLPSRKTSRIKAIDTYDGELESAFAPMSVTLRLEDEVDVSRGDMLVHEHDLPQITSRVEATLVWLHERPLDREKSYLVKHTSRWVRADIEAVRSTVDLETLADVPAEGVGLNDIARVVLRTHKPLFADAYRNNRVTGAFIVVDSVTNDTVAAGMLGGAAARELTAEDGGARSQVSAEERRERLGHRGSVVPVTGPNAEEVAYVAERLLFDRGVVAAVVPAGAAEACARAGVVALVAGASGADADGVASSEAAAADPDAAAAALVQALAQSGVVS